VRHVHTSYAVTCPRGDAAQAALVREVFGNPFRRVRARRAWRTPRVVSLAAAIYGKPLGRRMPDLGRALERAGCTDDRMIEHCRSRRPHVRGCWVVDLILGKS
jgi:hypothetical protein